MTIKTTLRQFDKSRKARMRGLLPTVFTCINNRKLHQKEALKTADINRIVIVRNNSRIGNMYFLLPFVREVVRCYPNAKIDLVLAHQWQASIFNNIGLNQIITTDLSAKNPVQSLATLIGLYQQEYDLVLSPNHSTANTFISALIPAKNKVSFKRDTTHSVFQHATLERSNYAHTATRPLSILEELGNDVDLNDSHTLKFSDHELKLGQENAESLGRAHHKTYAFFRGARGNKQLSNSAWKEILRQFEREQDAPIHWVEILSPDIKKPLLSPENSSTFSRADLRELGATLRCLDGFLCCDTGPLHLADAAGAKCHGFYTKTCPQTFGLLGKECKAVLLSLDVVKVAFNPVPRVA